MEPKDEAQRGTILQWEDIEGIDFWESKSKKPLRVMVAPNTQEKFIDFLNENDIKNEISIENVETLVYKTILSSSHTLDAKSFFVFLF